jgi:hypothetical protein
MPPMNFGTPNTMAWCSALVFLYTTRI